MSRSIAGESTLLKTGAAASVLAGPKIVRHLRQTAQRLYLTLARTGRWYRAAVVDPETEEEKAQWQQTSF